MLFKKLSPEEKLNKKLKELRMEYDKQLVKKQNELQLEYVPNEDVYVALKNIQKIYPNGVHSVIDFDLEIKKGEFIVFVGSSGCGKSTTLRMVCGLEDITAGGLYIDGVLSNELPPSERGVSMCFQNYALFPHLSVYENMAYGLKIKKVLAPKIDKEGKQIIGIDEESIAKLEKEKAWILKNDPTNETDIQKIDHDIEEYRTHEIPLMTKRKLTKKEIDEKINKAASILDLSELLNRKPGQLSGGQCQRVALGRVIVSDAKLLLMDEPLSNLDAKLRVSMRSEILKLHRLLNATTIYVTHDQVEAMTMSDRLVVMDKGRIMQIGTPKEVYDNPNCLFVATFIGSPSMNILDARMDNGILFLGDKKLCESKATNKKIRSFYEEKLQEEKEYFASLNEKFEGLLLEDETRIVEAKINKIEEMLHSNLFPLKLGIRPEDIAVGNGKLESIIDTFELINDEYHVYTTFNKTNLMFKTDSSTKLEKNKKIKFELNLDKIHLFDTIYERKI